HYHGGVRILSEAASANLASPIEVPFDHLATRARGFNPRERSWNFTNPWPGGRWTLRDIVGYQTDAAYALLENAARYRDVWLANFLTVESRAVRGWRGWPYAYVIPRQPRDTVGLTTLLGIRRRRRGWAACRAVPLLRRRDRRRVDAVGVRYVARAVRLGGGFRGASRQAGGAVRRGRAPRSIAGRAAHRPAARIPRAVPRRPGGRCRQGAALGVGAPSGAGGGPGRPGRGETGGRPGRLVRLPPPVPGSEHRDVPLAIQQLTGVGPVA